MRNNIQRFDNLGSYLFHMYKITSLFNIGRIYRSSIKLETQDLLNFNNLPNSKNIHKTL